MNLPKTNVRRYIEVGALVVVWMALGVFFRLGSTAYQAVGVGLALVFQLFVARRPLAELWVRTAGPIRFDRWVVTIVVMLSGTVALIFSLHRDLPAWTQNGRFPFLFLIIASVPAAFALRNTAGKRLCQAVPSIIAGKVSGWIWRWCVIGIGSLAGVASAPPPHLPVRLWPSFGVVFLFGFLSAFLVEEVVFRGALDTHVSLGETSRLGEYRSAIFVSVLWALWHLPLRAPLAATPLQQLGTALFVVGIAIGGVPLAFCWRRSGTLALSSALHASANAYFLTSIR